jgi:hypothetical protein
LSTTSAEDPLIEPVFVEGALTAILLGVGDLRKGESRDARDFVLALYSRSRRTVIPGLEVNKVVPGR